MKLLLSALFAFIFSVSNAQSAEPTKCFANFNEFKQNTPSLEYSLLLKYKTNGDVFMNGGINNYKLQKMKPLSKSYLVQEDIWGLTINDTVYVSTFPFSKVKGFNKLIERGYYSYFIGEATQHPGLQKQLGYVNENPKKFYFIRAPYVIMLTGEIRFLSFELLKKLVSDNEELSKELAAREATYDGYELFEYLRIYNCFKIGQ